MLRGPKRPKETGYSLNNARILARTACEQPVIIADESVIAVLFRDADGKVSAGRGNWVDKHDSILREFVTEGWGHGVPMLANLKSEGWFLRAFRHDEFQCVAAESGAGDGSGSVTVNQG